MFYCCNCKDNIISSLGDEFSYYDRNNSIQRVCHPCFVKINSKLKVEIDLSKLRLLKNKIIKKKYIR